MSGGIAWFEGKLSDACQSIDYGLTASASDNQAGPRFLRITDIVSGSINWKTVPFVEASESATEKYKLRDGDIVLARTGASTGASAYVSSPPDAVFASYLVRLKIKPDFDSRFIAYYMQSEAFKEGLNKYLAIPVAASLHLGVASNSHLLDQSHRFIPKFVQKRPHFRVLAHSLPPSPERWTQ
jgi:hypothetical protein